jgi:hypothetical protein
MNKQEFETGIESTGKYKESNGYSMQEHQAYVDGWYDCAELLKLLPDKQEPKTVFEKLKAKGLIAEGSSMETIESHSDQTDGEEPKNNEVRFNMPTDKDLIEIALLFNDGKIQKNKLAGMVGMCQFILDRLYENNDVTKPSSKE